MKEKGMKAGSHANTRQWLRILFLTAAVMLCAAAFRTGVQAAVKDGFVVQNGKGYYYENGVKHTGWLKLDGKWYYFFTDGSQRLGWVKNGDVYERYFNPVPGPQGYMLTGFAKVGTNQVRYFHTGNGIMQRGLVRINGQYRYFHNVTGLATTGLRKIGNDYYYFEPTSDYMTNGVLSKGHLRKIDGKVWFFNATSGAAVTGFQKIGTSTYYFDPKTYAMVTGEVRMITIVEKDRTYPYYFYNTGKMCMDGFKKLGSYTYYFNKNDGHGHIGWATLEGALRYFDSTGHLYISKTFEKNGKTYVADANGAVTELTAANTQTAIPATYNQYNKTYSYVDKGSYVSVTDSAGKTFAMASEYLSHEGVAFGKYSDRDLMAACVDAEMGDMGLIGMEAVAMTILNATIDPDFPADVRLVIYETNPLQFAVVKYPLNGKSAILRRLEGDYGDEAGKALAYQAVDNAIRIFTSYVKNGTPRSLGPTFNDGKDFSFLGFMSVDSWYALGSPDAKRAYQWYDCMFFHDWS